MPKPVQLIVACAANRVIGRAGRLPFDIPEDKQWFHEQTAGQTVVLGRVCYETWPQVLADGRQPVVITSQPERARRIASTKSERAIKPGTNNAALPLIAANVTLALELAQTLPGTVLVCGGQRIYEETLPLADRLLLTLVHTEVEGDTWFPEWRHLSWREAWRREGADANYRYTFMILERVR